MSETERVYESLGQRVAELRRARGLTQEQLADRMGIDARDVRRIEAGDNLTIDTLVKLAKALAVEIAALFEAPGTTRVRKAGRPVKYAAAANEPNMTISESSRPKSATRARRRTKNRP